MEHLRKIIKALDFFLVKFELISGIELKKTSKEVGGKFKENSRKITKFWKKIGETLRKFLGNFTLNSGGKSEENLWNFKINFENIGK